VNVKNFDFREVVTFFNRLPAAEIKEFRTLAAQPTATTAGSRKIRISLHVDRGTGGLGFWLKRWLDPGE
jgi:hypothetical protein